MITRRKFAGAMLGVSIAGIAVGSGGAFGKVVKAGATKQGGGVAKADAMRQRLAQIEAESGGRLGVSIVDTTSGLHAGLRTDERFPMCSTFKLLAAGFVLTRVDRGQEALERRVVFSKGDLVPYSPATSRHTRERTGDAGMSVADLCKAAITLSDNTAANLLLASFGGPAALTAFVRSIGDGITRLDRNEPTLNEATPGDPRDTTTPNAMLGNLRELLLGERLSSSSRAQLLAWLAANQTGGERIRAKLPKDWGVGDKTGTGDHGTANDVAILWPPGRGPILVTAYLTEASGDTARCNAAIAKVGALVAALV
ncbi:beta-lactamase [Paraburkholderia caffeinilytica]|uniref:Beta-lactamase n=1 Tax=Paraburkholderia caffeinilytica TaxID=1761016 RepID=A0ABQ1NEI0_9BURK|nr:class A beta-lactamase [Paraburkholderia caffeinilytica]AXL48840.1 beta-lactamase [Paraburkholderia caffeinilytica]GGC68254.1 beta-lactamase [Paraburkholderia caffeinilytica]CAB3784555.1 Beta-lactamase OXY-1 [Paraburkholderia caffeinilytica]